MKFQTKLYALAAAGLLGAVIISGVGFWSDRSQSALRDEQAAVADAQIAFNLGDMYHDHLDSLAYRALAAAEADDAAALDSATKEANETIASYEGVYARLAHLGLSAPALRALNSAHPDMRRFFGAARAQLAASRTSAKAAKDHLPTFAAAFDALEAKNEQVAKELERMGAAYTAHADTLGRKVRTVELAVLGLALLLAGAFANRVIAQLTRAVQRARLVATDISHGKLDTQIRVHGDDDIAEMLRALQSMQCTLVSFADAQHQLAREHGSGNIDHRIGAERFDGAYREMATGVNDLLDLNERTLHELLEVIRAYSAGDLSPSMRRLPGAQARVHEAADAVRDQLHSVNEDIRAVVQAGMEGDFSVRGNEEAVDHVYRDMVRALNQLMASSERGLGEVDAVLGALADGDLTRRADAALPGQLGALARNANSTAGQLAQVVAQIHQAAEELNTSTAEIAAGNHDLSERTEQQAAALEETASSMEELTSTVKQNADNASQAAQLAQHAADVARQGGEVVGDVVHTMSAISDSSRRIADIIGVIDGIAFQTNILALNAAVEAARAGEQGRGFAVVAAEVRSLAQRSATAAKEIKQLITVSVERVGEGAALVDRAGATMTGIVDSVQRVTDIVAEIAAASNEQNAGIGQINRAIAAMDEGTQQNTALVEEASASARSLEQQAEQLVHTVSVFRTGTELDGGRRTQASGRGRGTARGRAAVTLVDSGGPPVARIG